MAETQMGTQTFYSVKHPRNRFSDFNAGVTGVGGSLVWMWLSPSLNLRSRAYDPVMGRWLEEDPIGSLGGEASGAAAVVADALSIARDKVRTLFGTQHQDDPWLFPYVDGLNRYQIVKSDPTGTLDPSGLDRYVVGPEPHQGIAVDTWALVNGKWVWTGIAEYDFAADYRVGPFILGGGMFSCSGRVTSASGITAAVLKTVTSTPQQDMYLKSTLDANVINPPNYHIVFYNCRAFVQVHLRDGMPPERPATPHEVDEVRRKQIPLGY